MSRAEIIYAAKREPQTYAIGFDADCPVAGYYKMRLRSGGAFCAIRIWHGAPRDPIDGTILDRSLRWQATCNGTPIDLERVWPKCADKGIEEAEARHLVALQRWGRDAGHADLADPMRRINPLKSPLMF